MTIENKNIIEPVLNNDNNNADTKIHKGNVPIGFTHTKTNSSNSFCDCLTKKWECAKKCFAKGESLNVSFGTIEKYSIQISTLCIYALSIFLLAWAMPTMYAMLFEKEVAKTAIFYSPIDKKMVYTEQLRIDDDNAMEKSENHHADVAYKDEDGNYYTRLEFEAKIPFLYFRNMEMRGLLPLEIDGQSYDRARIEKYRRVLELNSHQLDYKKHEDKIYPLIESNPDQVALVLPADRFRMTKNSMEFIDSDINGYHAELTERFTDALIEKDFAFPAKKVWGNFTIFKPYEAGIFVLDAKGKTYHILRVNDKPKVVKVPFKEGIVPEKIIISEAKDKQLYGLMLDTNDNAYIFYTKNYALTLIPTPHYTSETMDFKVLLDPLYLTATYSDNKRIYAVAYPYDAENIQEELVAKHSFDMIMSRTQMPFYSYIAKIIFPFTIYLESENNSKSVFDIQFQGVYTLLTLLFQILLVLLYWQFCKRRGHYFSYAQGVSIGIFGIYVLIPLLLMEQYRKR